MADRDAVTPPYTSLVDFIVGHVSPEDILTFELSEVEKARAIDLLDKQDDDALSAVELAELDQMLVVEEIYMALKARALRAKS